MPPLVNKQTNKKTTKRSTGGNVLDRIAPMSFDDDEGISILLYGRSGSGKTTLWGSFPGPILAIVSSGGKRSGELRSLDTPENRRKIDQVVLEHSSEFKDVVQYQGQTGKYRTIVSDHISGLQDLTMKEICNMEEVPEQKSWGWASREQYGQSTAQCKQMYRWMLDLKEHCNIVIIGQEREGERDEASEIQIPNIGVATTPSLAGWLYPNVDYICETFLRAKMKASTTTQLGETVTTYTRTGEMEYCVRTGPHDVFTTKFRVPKGTKLPDVIVDPSYKKLYDLIKGAKQ